MSALVKNLVKFQSRYKAETSDLALMGWDEFMAANAPEWVQAFRKRARDKFAQIGVPTPKMERFKYTNIPAFLKKNELRFVAHEVTYKNNTAHAQNLAGLLNECPAWLGEMIVVDPVGEETYGDMMLWDVANAYLSDGLVVDIPANEAASKPLELTITGRDGSYAVPRSFVRLGDNSVFTMIEHHLGEGAYWNNQVTQIKVGKGATLRHYCLQGNSAEGMHTQHTHVEIEEGGVYEAFTLNDGARLGRHQIHVELLGENAECRLNGVNLLSGKQKNDVTITIEHHAPHCVSKQNYRSVLADQAAGTFQGKVHVHQAAQKTDGYQMANTLLLSPQASMNTKPELEIYADDVKCSHGATSGKLDEDALFYMRSRGIPESQARALLIEAFAVEALDGLSDENLDVDVRKMISSWLEEHA